MQRYSPGLENTDQRGGPDAVMDEDDTGDYVLFSDVQSALSKSQERVKELEAALRELLIACEEEFISPGTEGGEIPSKDDESVMGGEGGDSPITFGMIRRARSILGAKEEGNA